MKKIIRFLQNFYKVSDELVSILAFVTYEKID